MPPPPTDRLALDVGGANLKLAVANGPARSRPFALWKDPGALADNLRATAHGLDVPHSLLLTTTAELCDCFRTKREGVRAVLDAVEAAFPGRELHVWGTDGAFHAPNEIRSNPLVAAAANWLALAEVAARLAGGRRGLLVDVGSTTTDLIPLRGGAAVPAGREDTARLQTGELVYAGVRRTPVAALATEVPFRGRATGLASELFATTLDVYLTLGDIPDAPADRDTADGRPATADAARDRLARMVGSDRDDISGADARALARAADAALLGRLAAAAQRACGPLGGAPEVVITSGSGEFLARRLAGVVAPGAEVVSLETLWGPAASAAACARALIELASERLPR